MLKVVIVLCLLFLQACAHPMFYRSKGFGGTVVDVETNKPIEGVVVVAQWIPFHAGFGDGGHKSVMEVQEAVTDKDGKYYIPGWWLRMRKPMTYLDENDPMIFFLKRGYSFMSLVNVNPEWFFSTFKGNEKADFERFSEDVQNSSYFHPNRGFLRESVWDGRVVKLKRFKGSNKELRSLLRHYENFIFGEERFMRKTKYAVKEWSEFIKDIQPPLNYKELPEGVEKVLKEEFK